MNDCVLLSVRRPYESEDALLQHEAWTITRKSVFLIGMPAHPEGEQVRCQLALESGLQLLVAEGIVARYVESAGTRPSGLVVRFRRMSAASSQFVSRALGAREQPEKSSPSSSEASTSQPLLSRPSAVHAASSSDAGVVRALKTPSVNEALSRLLGRSPVTFPEVPHRAAALERLRLRHNASH